MKPGLRLTLWCSLFFLWTLYAAAQEIHQVNTPETLLPEFKVELLHPVDVEGDTLITFIYNGYIYAFSIKNEIPVWRMFIGGDLLNPFIREGDNIYFYDVYNRLYCVDLYKGKILWKYSVKDEIKGKPSFYRDYVLVSTQKGFIYGIDADTGNLHHQYTGKTEISTGIAIHNNLLIIPYKNGKIAAYDLQTRDERWVFISGGIITVSPVIKGDYLFFGSWDETFYALDVYTGKPLWVSYVGEDISREFLVFENEIILFFSAGEIMCLERADGEIRWVKYFKGVEFNYNYFPGINKFYIFTPDFLAVSKDDGSVIFNYRERAFNLYKEMLFRNMVEGVKPLSEKERAEILSEIYFTVSNYPLLPPEIVDNGIAYFIADDTNFYVYDINRDFFILKYKMS